MSDTGSLPPSPQHERQDGSDRPTRTPEEREILDAIAVDRGREYAERWAERILEQARAIGDL